MKKIFVFMVLVLIFLYSCASEELSFAKGIDKLNEFNLEFDSTLKSAPKTKEKTDELIAKLTDFMDLNKLDEPLDLLYSFRLKFLAAESMNYEGWRWGKASTTKYGFGCKNGFDRITNSSRIRNDSATLGFESVDLLQDFVDSFPEESKSLNLTQKDVLVLKTIYFSEAESAQKDARLIKSACKKD